MSGRKNRETHAPEWIGKAKKRVLTGQFIVTFLLSFVALSMLGEITVAIINTSVLPESNISYTVPLLVVPIFSVCVTVAIIYLNNRNNKQIDAIIEAFEKVARGDYSAKLKVPRRGRYKTIIINFNKMARELSDVRIFKDGFIHDFSHEFKTPIASINGFANLLLDGEVSEEEQKQYLHIIADESARLSALAENTLMLNRLENQQFLGEINSYRLDLQIKECVILLEREWSAKNISVISELQQTEFSGNAPLMQQVWLNILSNAIKFTPSYGEINVKLESKDGKIVASVRDSGIGMSEETMRHIFDKYYQGDSSRATRGNGLGLAIVKRIVNLGGGEVTVQSCPGEGSTFTVVFEKDN